MGQKVNSIIFRLGYKNYEWNSKYIEKNSKESLFYLYQDLEIKKYIFRFFKQYKILINNCKLERSENLLNIYISYYITLDTINLINNINKNQEILIKKKKKRFNNLKKRIWIIKYLKQKLYFKSNNFKFNMFGEKLLESLTYYTKFRLNITLIFENINKRTFFNLNNNQKNVLKKIILELKKYSKIYFFKEYLNILIVVVQKKNSSKLLAEFLALQFSILKYHNFFFNFIKNSLFLIVNSEISNVNGIKILIKGRLNGKPRSNDKIIQIGKISLQTLDSKINYSQNISFSQYGTFGIKVWVCEK